MISQYFQGDPLTTFLGASHIVLLPKVDHPDSFSKFWPINICAVAYMIFRSCWSRGLPSIA